MLTKSNIFLKYFIIFSQHAWIESLSTYQTTTINNVWQQMEQPCAALVITMQTHPMGEDEHTFLSPLPSDSLFGDGFWKSREDRQRMQ